MVTPPRPRTVQLKNISFKFPKPYQTANANFSNNSLPIVIKDRMKQPIANDKTRCGVLISNNGKEKTNIHQTLNSNRFSFRYFITFTSCL